MGMGETEPGGPSLLGWTVPVRGIRPRAVLGLLLIGSLAGTWLAHAGDSLPFRVVAWSTVVTLGLLLGGLYWRLVLFDRDGFETPEDSRYVRERWRLVETTSLWGFVSSGIAYFALGGGTVLGETGGVALATGLVLAPFLWGTMRRSALGEASRRKDALRSVLLLVVLVSAGGFAWLETGTSALDWVVRLAHVGAFSLWIGGAVWHNFVVLPTMQSRRDAGDALKSQAGRFRRHLPVVIALLLVTGLYQTDRLVGLSVPALVGSRVGQLIAFKLFALTVLTGLVVASLARRG